MQPLPWVLLGERCSGTNIIERLIECNSQYRPDWSIAGFKHFPRPIESTMVESLRGVPVVVVVRDPSRGSRAYIRALGMRLHILRIYRCLDL
jgi:hypothetical protein